MVLSPIHANYFTFDDWSVLSEIAVTAGEGIGDAALAAALDNRGRFLFRRRALDEARATHASALEKYEEMGDQRGICRSLNALGLIGLRTRELAEASEYFAATAERARQLGDSRLEGMARMNLAEAQLETGDAAAALQTIRPLPRFSADLRDPAYEGNALWLLSWAERIAGDLPAARAAIDAALRIAENASNRMWEAWWLVEAARVHLAAGETGEAMNCCRMAASLERQIGDRWQQALATIHLADCEQVLGQEDSGREHLVAALSLLQQFPGTRAAQLRADIQERLA